MNHLRARPKRERSITGRAGDPRNQPHWGTRKGGKKNREEKGRGRKGRFANIRGGKSGRKPTRRVRED